MPDKLVPQWAAAREFFTAFGWTVLGHDEVEADDLLGSLAAIERDAGGRALLFTGDRDMFQCVGDAVAVLWPGKGASRDGPELMTPTACERYGSSLTRFRLRAARRPVRRPTGGEGHR
jgi:DNA polymerase-1